MLLGMVLKMLLFTSSGIMSRPARLRLLETWGTTSSFGRRFRDFLAIPLSALEFHYIFCTYRE